MPGSTSQAAHAAEVSGDDAAQPDGQGTPSSTSQAARAGEASGPAVRVQDAPVASISEADEVLVNMLALEAAGYSLEGSI